MNEFKGGSISDMLDMLEQNSNNIQGVDRTAALKEITQLKNATIDERRRAQALLRSLSQGRAVLKDTHPSVTGRGRPAIGRNVITTEKPSSGTRPAYDISFYNRPDGTHMFTEDKPFKGGLKDSKSKALRYNLGDAFDKDIPNKSTVNITPTDSRRAKAYQRMTGGAVDFNIKNELNTATGKKRDTFDDAKSWKTNKGNFQPMSDGKFTKAKPNPADALRKPLIDAATSDKPITRQVGTFARFLRLPGAIPFNTIMLGADIGNWMKDNLSPNQSTSGRGGGRSALND